MTKKLTPQDQELWDIFTKGMRRKMCDTVKPDAPQHVKIAEKPSLKQPRVKLTQRVAVLHANELRNIYLDGRIDLHGLTQVAAENALREFLKMSAYKNCRWVVVITGKGAPDRPSILREQTPKWLESMPEFVTGYSQALPKDGGTGAFYIKIRKKITY